MDSFLKFFIPLYFALFGATFFWHSYRVWKNTGLNPYVLDKATGKQKLVARLFRPLGALVVTVVFASLYWSEAKDYFLLIGFLESAPIKSVALFVLILALFGVFIAQKQMGNSWKIGIDENCSVMLVEKGVFQFSRNPVFLGARLFLFGMFLLFPSVVMLVVLLFGELLIWLQVRFEEKYLTASCGEQYAAYCRRVRRWL